MKVGKLPNSLLKEIIIDKLRKERKEVLVRPGIGEDCGVVDFEGNVCVVSSDPITGAVNEVGRLAVHVSCNDIASCGAEPVGLVLTVLVPPGAEKEDIKTVMTQVNETAASLNVDIIGGHTEVTDAVTRFVIVSTVLGKTLRDKLVTTKGARPGDDIVITKSAGLEGTAIIAHDKENELVDKIGYDAVQRAKAFINRISVVKEGIIAGEFGVNSMHDVTEGGILGAVWEIAEASGTGALIFRDKIPIEEETLKICNNYCLDPLKLISSGCMIITCKNGGGLVKVLEDNGINATVIGSITESKEKKLVLKDMSVFIDEPLSDELYKVV